MITLQDNELCFTFPEIDRELKLLAKNELLRISAKLLKEDRSDAFEEYMRTHHFSVKADERPARQKWLSQTQNQLEKAIISYVGRKMLFEDNETPPFYNAYSISTHPTNS